MRAAPTVLPLAGGLQNELSMSHMPWGFLPHYSGLRPEATGPAGECLAGAAQAPARRQFPKMGAPLPRVRLPAMGCSRRRAVAPQRPSRGSSWLKGKRPLAQGPSTFIALSFHFQRLRSLSNESSLADAALAVQDNAVLRPTMWLVPMRNATIDPMPRPLLGEVFSVLEHQSASPEIA